MTARRQRGPDLSLLVGRTVEAYYLGQRSARVLRVAGGGRLTLRFLPPIGVRRVDLSALVGVHWRGRRRSLDQYLQLRQPRSES